MKKIILFTVLFAILGLIAGYLYFGKSQITGEYVKISNIFSSSGTIMGSIKNKVFETMRQNILTTGVVGAAIGFILSLLLKKK